ncbi:hypothetical protein DXK91_05685 [Parageobacillus toebii]|uniref:IS66 family transposase n=1 Tax=Parageobacillus thermoglucosidasius TaxID=1426 RepID=UPI000BE37384|nr:hypothetical protein CN643_12800 [Parageobacillus yumthangensis]PUF89733.1 hypothetical protein DCC82_12585 [Geobacillus sp. LYN3]RDE31736.1 hypothetical protein DV713_17265 [Parageobacillus thermoglucosidasius]RDV22884.1 hypothetical protein DXK91_05685 [Parageobacillus toebii]TXK89026.1 IS66 family transposase [Geobacillus sp. AYS3]TXK91404.1 IS66 family transposase [Parageobacillus sp. SY1]
MKHQVFDIPVIKVEVAQHEAEVKSCPCCGRLEQAEFPPDVTHHVQYGRRIRALVAYLHTVQRLLSARLVQLLEEWLDAPISEGSIYNIVQESAARLEELREPIQEKLLASPICTPMKRASPSKENGIGSMWPAHRKPRGCFAIPNGGGKR